MIITVIFCTCFACVVTSFEIFSPSNEHSQNLGFVAPGNETDLRYGDLYDRERRARLHHSTRFSREIQSVQEEVMHLITVADWNKQKTRRLSNILMETNDELGLLTADIDQFDHITHKLISAKTRRLSTLLNAQCALQEPQSYSVVRETLVNYGAELEEFIHSIFAFRENVPVESDALSRFAVGSSATIRRLASERDRINMGPNVGYLQSSELHTTMSYLYLREVYAEFLLDDINQVHLSNILKPLVPSVGVGVPDAAGRETLKSTEDLSNLVFIVQDKVADYIERLFESASEFPVSEIEPLVDQINNGIRLISSTTTPRRLNGLHSLYSTIRLILNLNLRMLTEGLIEFDVPEIQVLDSPVSIYVEKSIRSTAIKAIDTLIDVTGSNYLLKSAIVRLSATHPSTVSQRISQIVSSINDLNIVLEAGDAVISHDLDNTFIMLDIKSVREVTMFEQEVVNRLIDRQNLGNGSDKIAKFITQSNKGVSFRPVD